MEHEYPKIYLYKRIVQAKLFIDDHFSENICLENIADEASFSKFHFIRLFKTIYGKTPHQYLTTVRIEKAKLSLQAGIPVADTCYAVGFDSISSFTGLFKRHARHSPSEFQRLFMRRQEQIKTAPLRFIPHCFARQKGWIENGNFEEVS
jgi:AraC-like DNA-binding protein